MSDKQQRGGRMKLWRCEATKHDPRVCVPQLGEPDASWGEGVGVYLHRRLAANPKRISQIDADNNVSWTYSELLEKSRSVGAALRSRGILAGDGVAVCGSNCASVVPAMLGALFAGAKVLFIDTDLSPQEVTHIVGTVHVRLAFCDQQGHRLLGTLADAVVSLDEVSTILSCFPSDEFEPYVTSDWEEPAFVYPSSGTTGRSKSIVLSHRAVLLRSCKFENLPAFVVYGASKNSWVSYSLVVFISIVMGASFVVTRDNSPQNIIAIVRDYKVNLLLASPYQHTQVMRSKATIADMCSVRIAAVLGGKMGVAAMEQLQELMPESTISVGYGLTEVAGGFIEWDAFTDGDTIRRKRTSCGRVTPGNCVRIVDVVSGEDLGPGKPGEMLVKNNCLFTHYEGAPEATAAAFDADGYFRTGDLAFYDEDGCFYILSRISEEFKFRGDKVAFGDIEALLLQHEDVSEAAVVGVEADEEGYRSTAAVVVRQGAKVTPEQLRLFVDERMHERNRLHGGVVFIESMPKTPSDKIKRKILREMLQNEI